MSEENKNNDEPIEALPNVEFEDFNREEEPLNIGDGIEVIGDDSLENYSQKEGEEENEEPVLTLEETKKLLRYKLKREGDNTPVTDKMVDALTLEELDELNKVVKLRDRKALLKFVNRTKHVTDEEAENLTDEEFLDLTNKALIMSRFLTYNTKKDFGIKYKKKRQRKNNMAKRSRAANRA